MKSALIALHTTYLNLRKLQMCLEDDVYLNMGLKDGKLVFTNEVERGLECGCTCPHCGSRLIAKKGQIKQHHFAHYDADNCGKALETAIHLLAKEVLLRVKLVALPSTNQLSELAQIQIERRRFGYVADVGAVIVDTGEVIDIEIKVTHEVDAEKRERVISNKALMMEIDLAGLLNHSEVTRELISEAVLRAAPRKWVNELNFTQMTNNNGDDMNDKHLIAGFKAACGYSRKNQSNFDFQTLHVLVEQKDRSNANYQVKALGGYEQTNVPIKLTDELIAKMELQQYPTWATLKFDILLMNGSPKSIVTDIQF